MESEITPKDLLTVAQAAKRMKVSQQRVKVWLAEGRLHGWPHGREWIIPAATCRRPAKKKPGPVPASP